MSETQHAQTEEQTALTSDEANQNAAKVAEDNKAVPTPSGRWQRWMGVVGVLLALAALVIISWLSLRLQQLQVEVAGMQQSLAQASAQQQTLDALSDQMAKLNARLETISADQQQQLSQLQEQVGAFESQLNVLAQQKIPGWQLTDAPAVALMLGQLQSLSALGVEPLRLKWFVQKWQSVLTQAGVATDHALMQAIDSDMAALRLDAPVWSNSQDAWNQLSAQILAVQAQAPVPQVADEQTEPAWWEKWFKLIRITPVDGENIRLSEKLHQQSLWQVRAILALEEVRAGLVLSQAALVQEAADRLQRVLMQQVPTLATQWADTLDAWKRWQPPAPANWESIRRYLEAQQTSQQEIQP